MCSDAKMLHLAARAGARGFGAVEPNPMVGCVIGREGAGGVEILAVGRHRRYGELHAEADALRLCRERGLDPRGATVWVTLEPCRHQGKQPPCTGALIEAGVSRLVYSCADPNPVARGGAEVLAAAGIRVDRVRSVPAMRVSEPFVHRVRSGRPWVIAKWAQTLDGCVATRTGDSKWISSEASRRDVHRLRGRVDAILTGIGTVLADDPRLTARGVALRRVARRVVLDPQGRLPLDCELVRGVQGGGPLSVVVGRGVLQGNAEWYRVLLERGVDVVAFDTDEGTGGIDPSVLLSWLAAERGCATVMLESGPGLLGSFHAAGVLDELRVYIAPKLLGDRAGRHAVDSGPAARIADASEYELVHTKTFGSDLRVTYRRPMAG